MLHPLRRGLRDSLPIALGYLPAAFSFGLTGVQAGLPKLLVALISVVVYAGGAQFVLVALLAAGAALPTLVGAVLLMNARHLLYGATVAQGLAPRTRLPRALLAFGLTDEVFARTAGRLADIADLPAREHWLLGVQIGAYAAWVAGTLLGAGVADQLASRWPLAAQALGFVLPALFLALLLDTDWRRQGLPVIGAALAVLLALAGGLATHLAIPLGMLAGAAAAVAAQQVREHRTADPSVEGLAGGHGGGRSDA